MEFTNLIKTSKVDDVILTRNDGRQKCVGTLCLTSHHLIFADRRSEDSSEELMVLYMFIEQLEKKLSPNGGLLTITLKDFTQFKLKFAGQDEVLNVAQSIDALSAHESASKYYPYYVNRIAFTVENDGWKQFNIREHLAKVIGPDNSRWRVADVNTEYELCKSYPKYTIVPFAATNEMIKKCAKFRHAGRYPTLCYLHNNSVPLLRSGQPLAGAGGKRCKDDEKLLMLSRYGHTKKGVIVDTRSQQQATNHRSKGGGYETDDHYSQWKRTFHNIEPWHTLSECVGKLYEACADSKNNMWLAKLESSGWLAYVQDVLVACVQTANFIHNEGVPVLVHGEVGTDSTLLVTSLTQVLLNPNYRTIQGLQTLIMREWVWAGHPFTERNLKVGVSQNRRRMHAPVFLMFLDCLHQIMSQYPCSFEYTEDLLLMLAKNVYASEFGTFLFNNEQQREVSKLSELTVSFWSYVNRKQMLAQLTNPVYERNPYVLRLSTAPQTINVWEELFMKNTSLRRMSARSGIKETILNAKNNNNMLKNTAIQLQQEYEKLREEYMGK